MKKTLTILCMLCTGLVMYAQKGIVSTREANASSGRLLTMEETILSRDLSPANLRCMWTGSTLILMHKDGKWQTLDTETGLYTPFGGQSHKRTEAVTEGNSLYIKKADGSMTAVAVSESGDITYGQSVSRNEFGIDGGIFWSPDSTRLAFYRKDESKVTSFPLLDITTRTGSLREIKYPMAGMDSEEVSVGIYDLESGSTAYIKEDSFGPDRYLTNVCWSPDGAHIFIQVLDRSQKHLKLNMYCAKTGEFEKTLLTEDNSKYVEPQDPIHFIKGHDRLFIYRTDNRDGYRNLYLCDLDGNVRRLTCTDADVEYIGNDGKHVWYTSAEVSPVENHLFRIGLRIPASAASKGAAAVKAGKPERLTQEEGWHEIAMNEDCSMYVDSWSSLCTPRITDLCTGDGKVKERLLEAEDPTLDYAYTEISLGTVKSADGAFDNWYRLIKPKDFDPSKKYPVIVYVYGGPHSQMVRNTFMAELRRWEMYMAQRGYIVYVQDNRGTSNRGAAFEKAIHGQCGQAEMADQMEGVKMLMELPFVDRDRIGVHGWSYGGFMTISLITNYPDVFKVAVAGGPVIDWKWYEVMYGERYMDNPAVNPEGYGKVSLINKAADLKGKLLICQGAIDPVVVWEHSLSFVRECVKNNVQVDYFPYPCHEHNVIGKDRVHLMDKVSMYFEDYL
ncbi:MAG: S9 family peptidase [Bacteroidales bacterium]|nr:S9 family peptidase [Bacteroidales bacterium]MDE6147382.1 S9 family peptidase [Bacteroidales bacterium]